MNELQAERPRYKNTIHLWEFLMELLHNERYASIIEWTRREHGEFKLKKQEEVARQWGLLKQRKGMTYDKLSRSLRYYYDKKIITKVSGQKLVYKFLNLPFEYLPLRNMDQSTRRRQLQGHSKAFPIPPQSSKPVPDHTVSSEEPRETTFHLIRPSVICSAEPRNVYVSPPVSNTNVNNISVTRIVSKSQIIFPSCRCIMASSQILKP